ncbi:lysine 2,3-aminomutase, partial [bacterium]|nr:lysine 2,3-aminomutase [bacterium]
TPLLTGINDTPEQIHAIAFKCREIGIEFNHVYLAGLPIQRKWLSKKPFNLPEIVDIASYVREFGSGRELPRYIIRTPLGEVDFGLTSETRGTKDGNVLLKLMPYDIAYYKHMKSNFRFDPNIEIDIDGCPIVPVEGLVIKKGCDMIF